VDNLVLAVAAGMKPESLTSFLRSVDANAARGAGVALIVTPGMVPALGELLAELRLPARLYDADALKAALPAHVRPSLLLVQRFWMQLAVLEDLRDGGQLFPAALIAAFRWPCAPVRPPSAVLLTDVRDVVVQRDPFADLAGVLGARGCEEPVIVAAQEATQRTVGSCPYNSLWMAECGGEGLAAAYAPTHILCAGTTLATLPGMLVYLNEGMLQANFACQRLYDGMDQAVHNILLRPLPPAARQALMGDARTAALQTAAAAVQRDARVIITPAEGDWLCTVGYYTQEQVADRMDGDGNILGADTASSGGAPRPCAVVHQFDRLPDVAAQVAARYGRPPGGAGGNSGGGANGGRRAAPLTVAAGA
jgi:hypothetical protein